MRGIVVVLLLVALGGCNQHIVLCRSFHGTFGEAERLAIYTPVWEARLETGAVPAVALGQGRLLVAKLDGGSPCDGGQYERVPPDELLSVTFDPPTLARLDSWSIVDDEIVVVFTALAEGDGTVTVRAVFGGDEREDRREFRVRAFEDVAFYPWVSGGGTFDPSGPFVEGAVWPVIYWPTTRDGEPLAMDRPPLPWTRADGALEVTDDDPDDDTSYVHWPMAGQIPAFAATAPAESIPVSNVEIVAAAAIVDGSIDEVSDPAVLPGCPVGEAFLADVTLNDAGGRLIKGGNFLLSSNNPSVVDVRPFDDPVQAYVRCLATGSATLRVDLPGTSVQLAIMVE